MLYVDVANLHDEPGGEDGSDEHETDLATKVLAHDTTENSGWDHGEGGKTGWRRKNELLNEYYSILRP